MISIEHSVKKEWGLNVLRENNKHKNMTDADTMTVCCVWCETRQFYASDN